MSEGEPPIESQPPRSALAPSPGKGPWIVAALVVLLLVGAVTFWMTRKGPPSPSPPPSPEPVASPAPEPTPAPAPAAPAEPAKLEDVSSDALYRAGLKGDVHRRWAIVTDNLAEGVSPRKQLDFLAPSKPFSVERRGEVTVMSPASYRRYDSFADAVGSVDVAKLLAVYRTIHVELEHAYRALGYPSASLDAVSVRALRRILAVHAPKGELAVEETEAKGIYAFADPKLEELGAVEKHLLRMGPRNLRIIQGKAREILQQLGPVRVEPGKQ